MKSRTKLVFFVFPIKFFISHRLPIAVRAIKSGYEVHLISTSGEGEDTLRSYGINFHKIDITRSKANLIQELKTIRQLYSIYKTIMPDIVHHITIKPVLYGTLAARLTGIGAVVNAFSGLGYVFTARGIKATFVRAIIKLAYRIILKHKNLATIVQNHDDQAYLQSRSIIKKSQTILIKGSGVNLNHFYVTKEPLVVTVVLFPARLLKDKGIIEFIEASEILHQNKIKVRMVLVGDIDRGNPSSITKEELERWCGEGTVEHWGFSSDMPETYRKSNIVCLPSYREGLPKTLIEATASGRAIVTTDVPGCREMIDPKAPNGMLIPVKNSVLLAQAIEELIINPEKRLQMAKNGRRMAEREFSIEQVVDATLDVYKKLIN